jgi:protoporphyrinogen oxidase
VSTIAVFGAGMAGLAAARDLARRGHEVHVYEAAPQPGGLAASYAADGFRYDHGPHYIFSSLAETLGIAAECDPVPYYEDLQVGGRRYRFPFGFVRHPGYCLSVGMATVLRPLRRRPRDVAELFVNYYGDRFAREVLIPLIEKWSGEPATGLSLDFANRFLPASPGYLLYSLVKRLRGGVTEDYYKKGRTIVYPRDGCAAIFRALEATPGVTVRLSAPLTALATAGDRVTGARVGDTAIVADQYVSTVPLPDLCRFLGAPAAVRDWQRLRYRGLRLLFLRVARPRLLATLWTWFPEPRFPFYRIAEYKNAGRHLAPPDETLISVEIGYDPDAAPVTAAGLLAAVQPHLAELYGLRPREVLGATLRESPAAYPVMRTATDAIQRALTHETPFQNLFLAGRTGLFQYRMLEGAYESGVTCAAAVQARLDGVAAPAHGPDARDAWGRPLRPPE